MEYVIRVVNELPYAVVTKRVGYDIFEYRPFEKWWVKEPVAEARTMRSVEEAVQRHKCDKILNELRAKLTEIESENRYGVIYTSVSEEEAENMRRDEWRSMGQMFVGNLWEKWEAAHIHNDIFFVRCEISDARDTRRQYYAMRGDGVEQIVQIIADWNEDNGG